MVGLYAVNNMTISNGISTPKFISNVTWVPPDHTIENHIGRISNIFNISEGAEPQKAQAQWITTDSLGTIQNGRSGNSS